MRLTLPLILATLVLPGCAYIGQVEFELKRDALDHDKDGAPFGGANKDCNDFEPLEAPGNPEIPYDGFDNDCDGSDVVDADGDGFPGISKEDYLALNPDAEWPSNVVDGQVDCADDIAIWPTAAQIFPGNTTDEEYDGIDADCAGDNDFDADGDGYMPDEMADAFDAYVAAWGYTHLEADRVLGDCNDFRAEANPGILPEADVWYDGDDDDCADNNDFDADGDGYMPNTHPDTGDPLDADYQDFIEEYHGGTAPWTEQWDDCLDQPHPTLPAAIPSSVYPGNTTDTPYDGIDSDCACDNDFDADVDGAMPDTATAGFPTFVTDWDCTALVEAYGDCDDNDSAAYPGAIELLGDGADSDCDLDVDTTPFAFDVLRWDYPRPPRAIKTDNHYLLVAAGDHVDLGGLVKEHAGLVLPFALDAGFMPDLDTNPTQWQGAAAPLPIGGVIDAAADGADMSGAITYTFPGVSSYELVKHLDYSVGTNTYVSGWSEWTLVPQNGFTYDATSINVQLDSNGHPWSVACGVDTIHVLRGDGDSGSSTVGSVIFPNPLNPAGAPSGMCFFNGPPTDIEPFPGTYEGSVEIVACEPGIDCAVYDFDVATANLSLAAVNSWAGWTLDYGRYKDGWHILVETGQAGAIVAGPQGTNTVLPGWTVHNIDAHWRDMNTSGTGPSDWYLYVAAVAEPTTPDGSGPRVVLAWGSDDGPLTEKVLPYTNPAIPDLVPTGVGIYADEDRLFLGVSAENTAQDVYCYTGTGSTTANDYCLNDTVGWVFFGWP